MTGVERLATFVELDEHASDRLFSVHARHEAVLGDGTRVLLLDDRGWTSSGPPDIWAHTSALDVERTATMVVGPDEPFEDQAAEDPVRGHWAALAKTLGRAGVHVSPQALRSLPHEVVMGELLRGRLRG